MTALGKERRPRNRTSPTGLVGFDAIGFGRTRLQVLQPAAQRHAMTCMVRSASLRPQRLRPPPNREPRPRSPPTSPSAA